MTPLVPVQKPKRKQAPVKVRQAREEKNPAILGWSRWYILADKDKRTNELLYRVRRYTRVNGKIRYQSIDFADLREYENDKAKLDKLVEQLNVRYVSDKDKAEKAYHFKHLFITQEVKDSFRTELLARINDKKHARSMYSYLERNVLHWFINLQSKPDPIDWKRNETKWGQALLCQLEGKEADKFKIWDEPAYPDTISKQIQVANRFLAYLHKQYTDVIPFIKLEPISRSVMSEYRARFTPGDDYVPGKFITDEDWQRIEERLDKVPKNEKDNDYRDIAPFVRLQYKLGLRRAESMAVLEDNIREGCVKITQQLSAYTEEIPVYRPTKSKKNRDVEYWFTKPDEVYEIVNSIEKLMHPSTYSHKFAELMTELQMDYSTHDMRRTWITRAFRAGKNHRDIQLGAGHANLKTTLRYAQDDRKLERDKRFVPKRPTRHLGLAKSVASVVS